MVRKLKWRMVVVEEKKEKLCCTDKARPVESVENGVKGLDEGEGRTGERERRSEATQGTGIVRFAVETLAGDE